MWIFLTLVILATIIVVYYIKTRKTKEGRTNFPDENDQQQGESQKQL